MGERALLVTAHARGERTPNTHRAVARLRRGFGCGEDLAAARFWLRTHLMLEGVIEEGNLSLSPPTRCPAAHAHRAVAGWHDEREVCA